MSDDCRAAVTALSTSADVGRPHAEARPEGLRKRREVAVAHERRDLADAIAARLQQEHRLVEAPAPDVRERTAAELALERAEQRAGARPAAAYYAHRARRADPSRRPARAKPDEELRPEIRRAWTNSYGGVYGANKVWRQLGREGIAVARCTVERLMREMGLRGAVRGRASKITTEADEAATRPPDLVEREFHAERPNQLWVADLTCVATWAGFVYVAFVIADFSRAIVAWRESGTTKVGSRERSL